MIFAYQPINIDRSHQQLFSHNRLQSRFSSNCWRCFPVCILRLPAYVAQSHLILVHPANPPNVGVAGPFWRIISTISVRNGEFIHTFDSELLREFGSSEDRTPKAVRGL